MIRMHLVCLTGIKAWRSVMKAKLRSGQECVQQKKFRGFHIPKKGSCLEQQSTHLSHFRKIEMSGRKVWPNAAKRIQTRFHVDVKSQGVSGVQNRFGSVFFTQLFFSFFGLQAKIPTDSGMGHQEHG